MPRAQPPAGFVRIGPDIYISLAPAAALQPDDSAPNVILIFGWMGAHIRHLQHYSRKYTELYPHATQIIVKTEPSFFVTPERALKKRLTPVADALECLGCLPTANSSAQESTRIRPRVLVHLFSNGGGTQVALLGRLLSSRYPSITPTDHLVSALILDSSPSIGDFRTARKAFEIAIRNPIALYLIVTTIYIMLAFRLFLNQVCGVEMRYPKNLHHPHLLPWMKAETPRLYVFSKKDELVPWTEVDQHAETAKLSGLNVRCELYEDSAHVAHMRHDPKRYWESIQDVWEVACRQSEVQASKDA